MIYLKQKLKNKLVYFNYFYRYLGPRVFVLLFASIIVGVLDGIGLAMFLPVVELLENSTKLVSIKNLGTIGGVISKIFPSVLEINIWIILVFTLIIFILKGSFVFLQKYLEAAYKQLFISRLRENNIKLFRNYRYEAYVKSDAGVIQNMLTGEVWKIVVGFRSYLRMTQHIVLISTYTIMALITNVEFALIVSFCSLIVGRIYKRLYRVTVKLSNEVVNLNNEFQNLTIQFVSFFKYLKATSSSFLYSKNLISKVKHIESSNLKMGILSAIIDGSREPLMVFIVLGSVVLEVFVFNASIGSIVLSLLFFYRALSSLTVFQSSYNEFLGSTGSIDQMKIFEQDLLEQQENPGNEIIQNFPPNIELTNVCYNYGDGVNVVNNVSIKIKPNETIAFIGESGSGKTTLANLISGLIHPTSGDILMDGVATSEINLKLFQNQVGYITQEPVIFDDSLFNNITSWSPIEEENVNAFKKALLDVELSNILQNKSDTFQRLGNNGVMLSGGQRQRVSVARELYKKSKIMILDEATSALDSKTENEIKKTINKIKGQATIIIVAHRLSTIKDVDCIYILEKGKIVESGSFKSLSENSDRFIQMLQAQHL